MSQLITGLHHVTAIVADAQKNVDFYAGILGLRMVKKTVNFDAPEIYHLYYGNEEASPGTIITFFPYPGLVSGRKGKGQLTATAFSIPENSLDYWMKRLAKFNVPFAIPQQRFDAEVFIYLEDPDGLGIELVANTTDTRKGFTYGQLPQEYAVKGLYSVSIEEEGYERTAGLLTQQMDHRLILEKGNRFRFSASGKPGDLVDVICSPGSLKGLNGSGTVHHLAFATASDESQLIFREKVNRTGIVNTTPVLDRKYFHSVYFREPGGVLFEVATNPPGFTVDESKEQLGTSLQLPPWEEPNRQRIESILTTVQLNPEKFMD